MRAVVAAPEPPPPRKQSGKKATGSCREGEGEDPGGQGGQERLTCVVVPRQDHALFCCLAHTAGDGETLGNLV